MGARVLKAYSFTPDSVRRDLKYIAMCLRYESMSLFDYRKQNFGFDNRKKIVKKIRALPKFVKNMHGTVNFCFGSALLLKRFQLKLNIKKVHSDRESLKKNWKVT